MQDLTPLFPTIPDRDRIPDRVVRHRQIFFKVGWVDYDTLRRGNLRLAPLPDQESGWRRDYEAMRGEMFFDEPPSFDAVLDVIKGFEEAFNR